VTVRKQKTAPIDESQLAAVLEYRYGDGQIYLPRHAPRNLLSEAVQRGFVDAEGYLTRQGRMFLASHSV